MSCIEMYQCPSVEVTSLLTTLLPEDTDPALGFVRFSSCSIHPDTMLRCFPPRLLTGALAFVSCLSHWISSHSIINPRMVEGVFARAGDPRSQRTIFWAPFCALSNLTQQVPLLIRDF